MADKNPAHAEDSSLFKVVRVARDGKSAIVKHPTEGVYTALSLENGKNLYPSVTEFSEIITKGSWRKVSSDEETSLVASIEAASFESMTEISSNAKPYRVPAAVQEEIRSALSLTASAGFSGRDLKIAQSLAYDESVGRTEVEWVDSFFNDYDAPERLRGGYKGRKWASRILNPEPGDMFEDDPVTAEKVYDFDDETFAYYAASAELDSPFGEDLLAIDFESGAVYIWGESGFELMGTDFDTVEAPTLTLIDQYTAEALARYIDEGGEDRFNVVEADPYEYNLFAMAESEIDFEELDRVSSLIAAGVGKYGGIDLDPNDYTPEERSINAKRQVRGQGGKFGGPQIKPGAKLLGFTKARLATELPLVANPAGRIQEFIANAPVTAAGAPVTSVTDGAANPNPAPQAPTEPVQAEAVDKATQPDESQPILYFAIVDNADKTAVLNCVGITKNAEGQPEAWMRENGGWKTSPELLGQLTGATPPPVVELAVPEPAKGILAQIDQYDASKGEFPTDAIPNDPKQDEALVASAAQRGFALPSGDLLIWDASDLTAAITEFANLDEYTQLEAREHIRKRARALNRMDLVPEEIRTPTLQEIGELQARTSPLYSTYGELLPTAQAIVASVKSGHRGNTETLMNYWAYGKGAAKIRWGTRGDLTRAHRHLAKYVGPERAWGLAQNLHKRIFGVSNITHDRAVGHYRGR